MKDKKIKAWALIDEKGNIMKCNCHPSKKTSYVIYARKGNQFSDKYWRQVTITLHIKN